MTIHKSPYHQISMLLLILVLLAPSAVFAAMQEEIDHLLNYIKTSDCEFIRNNKSYAPDKAVKHIEKKYDYLKKRIKSTEDFIKGAATESSMSGKPYMIICAGKEMATADWLRVELQRYRTLQQEK
jgi:hypothetical protein